MMIESFKRLLAFFASLSAPTKNTTVLEIYPKRKLAWGQKVSAEFRDKVFEIAGALQVEADYLMACMAWESAETFSPSIKNMAGSGATGLIQFMPATAKGLGTTTDALAALSAVEQLEWVRTYFKPYSGRLLTLSDLYCAILWPRAIGKPDSYVLWEKGSHPTTYRQNAGLDLDGDHDIEKQEAAAKVYEKLQKGRSSKYLWVET